MRCSNIGFSNPRSACCGATMCQFLSTSASRSSTRPISRWRACCRLATIRHCTQQSTRRSVCEPPTNDSAHRRGQPTCGGWEARTASPSSFVLRRDRGGCGVGRCRAGAFPARSGSARHPRLLRRGGARSRGACSCRSPGRVVVLPLDRDRCGSPPGSADHPQCRRSTCGMVRGRAHRPTIVMTAVHSGRSQLLIRSTSRCVGRGGDERESNPPNGARPSRPL